MRMRAMKYFVNGLVIAVLGMVSTVAAEDVDVTYDMSPEGEVYIVNVAGTIDVSAWHHFAKPDATGAYHAATCGGSSNAHRSDYRRAVGSCCHCALGCHRSEGARSNFGVAAIG